MEDYLKIDVTDISSVIRLDKKASIDRMIAEARLLRKSLRADQLEQYVFDSDGHKWVLSAYAGADNRSQMFLYCDNGDCFDDTNSNAVEVFGYLHLVELARSVLDSFSISEHSHLNDDEHVMRTLERCVRCRENVSEQLSGTSQQERISSLNQFLRPESASTRRQKQSEKRKNQTRRSEQETTRSGL